MNIVPFGDRVLIKPVEKRTGPIPLSEQGALSEYGEVIAVGSEVKTIKVGETYGFSVFGVEKLVIDEKKFYFLRESSDFILGRIEQ